MPISTEDIAQLIRSDLEDAKVEVTGGEGKFQLNVIADEFEGLNAVKRQQRIYRIINEHINSGVIHAVTMRLQTNNEHNTA